MSEKEADKIIKQEERERETAKKFCEKTGMKQNKDGTPDILGHVLGGYHRSIERAHELTKKCEECKELIGLNRTYLTRQEKGSEQVIYYHNDCYIRKGTTSNDPN
jgi:hypothetical protein